jgi:RNA processing factor Prp31
MGAGAATGFVTAIVTLLGWNRRMSKLEDDKADTVIVDVLDKKLDDLREEFRYMRTRLDEIYTRLTK